jgi:hypothetical protein
MQRAVVAFSASLREVDAGRGDKRVPTIHGRRPYASAGAPALSLSMEEPAPEEGTIDTVSRRVLAEMAASGWHAVPMADD